MSIEDDYGPSPEEIEKDYGKPYGGLGKFVSNAIQEIKDWGGTVADDASNIHLSDFAGVGGIMSANADDTGLAPDTDMDINPYSAEKVDKLYEDAIANPAGKIAVTPFIPAPIRAGAAALYAPKLAADTIDTYDKYSNGNGNGDDGSTLGNIANTANDILIQPIYQPAKNLVTDPSGFVENIENDPSRIFSDVLLPGSVIHGGAKKAYDIGKEGYDNFKAGEEGYNTMAADERYNGEPIPETDFEDVYGDAPEQTQSNTGGGDTFFDAVSDQESGGNYNAQNADTGAYGKFQIMPDNWEPWKDEAAAAGVDVGSGEMSDPAAQEAVARFKLNQYRSEYGDEGALVAWYAGPENGRRWAAGETTDVWGRPWDAAQGNGPSIKSYVDSAMNHAAERGYKGGDNGRNVDTSAYNDDNNGLLNDIDNEDSGIEAENDAGGDILNDEDTTHSETDLNDSIPKKIENDTVPDIKDEPAENGSELNNRSMAEVKDYDDAMDYDKNQELENGVRTTVDNLHKELINSLENKEPERFEASKNELPTRQEIDDMVDIMDKTARGEKLDTIDMLRTPAGKDVMKTFGDEMKQIDGAENYHDVAMNGDYVRAANMARAAGDTGFADAYQKLADTQGGTVPPKPMLKPIQNKSYSNSNGSINIKDILQAGEDLFLPVHSGTVKKGIKGYVDHNSGYIRTKDFGDLETLSHEIGHTVDAALGLRGKAGNFDNEFRRVVQDRFGNAYKPSEYRSEGIAEFMHDFLTNKAKAQKEFPRYFDAFRRAISKSPDMQQRVNIMNGLYDKWYKQSPEARGRSSFVSGDEKRPLRERLKEKKFLAKKYFVDENAALQELDKRSAEIKGKPLTFDEKAYDKKRFWNSAVHGLESMLINPRRNYSAKNWKAAIEDTLGLGKNVIKYHMTFKDALNPLKAVPESLIKSLGLTHAKEWLSEYLIAMRVREIQSYKPDYKGPKMSRSDMMNIIRNAPNGIKQAAENIYKINTNLLRIKYAAGVISKEQYIVLSKFKHYIGLYRDFSDQGAIGELGISPKGMLNVNNGIKKLSDYGNTHPALDPLESVMQDIHSTLNIVARNEVGKTLANLTNYHGMGELVRKSPVRETSAKDSRFYVWENGKKEFYETQPEIYEAFQNQDKLTSNALVKMILYAPRMLTNFLRSGATLTPSFSPKNFTRDIQSAFLNTRGNNTVGGLLPGNIVKAGFSLFKGDELAAKFEASGAMNAALYDMGRDSLSYEINNMLGVGKKQKIIKYNPVEVLRAISEPMEAINRYPEYRKVLADTGSIPEATIAAKEITTDFSRHGALGKYINSISAFHNASVQGLRQFYNNVTNHPVKYLTKAALTITLPSVVLWNYNHNQQWYQDMPQYQRDLFWLIKKPGYVDPTYHDDIYRIAKPEAPGLLFGSLVERGLDWAFHSNKRNGFQDFAKSIGGLVPNLLPDTLNVLAVWGANYDTFMGRNIVSDSMSNREAKYQFTSNTSELAKKIGSMFNISPLKIDKTIQDVTGNLGAETINAAEHFSGVSNRPYKNPIEKAFMVNSLQNSQSLQDYYDNLNDIKAKYDTYKNRGGGMNDIDKKNYSRLNNSEKMMQDIGKWERHYQDIGDDAKAKEMQEKKINLARTVLSGLK